MSGLTNHIPNGVEFLRYNCPNLFKLISPSGKKLFAAPSSEPTGDGFTNNFDIRNIVTNSGAKTVNVEIVSGFTEIKGIIALVSEVIDLKSGRMLGGNAVTVSNSHSLTDNICLDLSAYTDINSVKPMVRTVFYWTETQPDGSVTMRSYERRQELSDIMNAEFVENITVTEPNTLKQRDATVILYGRTAEYHYDDPDKVYKDVHAQNGKLPVFIPFSGSARVSSGYKIIGVAKEDSSVSIEHPQYHTKAVFMKDKNHNWDDIKWNYDSGNRTVFWEFPDNWRTEIDLAHLNASSYFNFNAILSLLVDIGAEGGTPISVKINIGTDIPESPLNCRVKKLYLQWGCLSKYTMITMSDGTEKLVSEIKAGEKILAGSSEATVLDIYKGTEDNLICIRTETGKEVEVTAGHPILTEKGWKRASDINAGDRVSTSSGGFESLTGLYLKPYNDVVFNISTDNDLHLVIANSIIVGDFENQNTPKLSKDEIRVSEDNEELYREMQVYISEINRINNFKE